MNEPRKQPYRNPPSKGEYASTRPPIKGWQVLINVQCRGPSFRGPDKQIHPDSGIVRVLQQIIDRIQNGESIEEMHGNRIISESGCDVGTIVVARPAELMLRRDQLEDDYVHDPERYG